jgi:hypothetical protein
MCILIYIHKYNIISTIRAIETTYIKQYITSVSNNHIYMNMCYTSD